MMKTLLLSLLGFAGFVLMGCAGTSNSSTATSVGTCSTGYVYTTSYGCLPQSGCSSGYALYNNQCIYVGTTTSTTCTTGYTWNGSTCVYTGTTTTTYNQCGGTCPAGYNQTAYGCLPQYRCQTCFGYTQGYCVNSAGQYYWGGY